MFRNYVFTLSVLSFLVMGQAVTRDHQRSGTDLHARKRWMDAQPRHSD